MDEAPDESQKYVGNSHRLLAEKLLDVFAIGKFVGREFKAATHDEVAGAISRSLFALDFRMRPEKNKGVKKRAKPETE